MKPVIIIPAYNPPESFIDLIIKIKKISSLDVIIIDDGSFQSIHFESRYCTIIKHEKNHGKGYALLNGFKYAKSEVKI